MTRHRSHVSEAIAVVIVCVSVCAATVSLRAGRSAGRVDPKALALFKASEAALAQITSVSAVHRFTTHDPTYESDSFAETRLRLSRPNLFRVDTTTKTTRTTKQATQVYEFSATSISDGAKRWHLTTSTMAARAGQPAQTRTSCTTSAAHPTNQDRELEIFDNALYWGFFDLGDWQYRSALLGFWSTRNRLVDPGLRRVQYGGTETWNDERYDVVDWVYTVSANLPEDDPVYTTRVYFGSDHLIHRIVTTDTKGRRQEETLAELRVDEPMTKESFTATVPESVTCRDEVLDDTKYFQVGERVPDFTLHTPDGKSLSLADLRKGKRAILINFWSYG